MGAITFSGDITRPMVWPLHTLLEAKEILVLRLNHPLTKAAGRALAQASLSRVEDAIKEKKKAKRKEDAYRRSLC